jgi:hypothetical protein
MQQIKKRLQYKSVKFYGSKLILVNSNLYKHKTWFKFMF